MVYIKHCRGKAALQRELSVYNSGFPYAPTLHKVEGLDLHLTRVAGIPYLDTPFMDTMLQALAEAIASLHNLHREDGKVLCHWDNQPRNILWDEQSQRIWLIDFEDSRLAYPEQDIAHLLLFWAEAMLLPDFTHNVTTFIRYYNHNTPMDYSRWQCAMQKAIRRFDSRRRKHRKKEPIQHPDRKANRSYLKHLF